MKVRFESDDDLPLRKILSIPNSSSRRQQLLSTSLFIWICVWICGWVIKSMEFLYKKH